MKFICILLIFNFALKIFTLDKIQLSEAYIKSELSISNNSNNYLLKENEQKNHSNANKIMKRVFIEFDASSLLGKVDEKITYTMNIDIDKKIYDVTLIHDIPKNAVDIRVEISSPDVKIKDYKIENSDDIEYKAAKIIMNVSDLKDLDPATLDLTYSYNLNGLYISNSEEHKIKELEKLVDPNLEITSFTIYLKNVDFNKVEKKVYSKGRLVSNEDPIIKSIFNLKVNEKDKKFAFSFKKEKIKNSFEFLISSSKLKQKVSSTHKMLVNNIFEGIKTNSKSNNKNSHQDDDTLGGTIAAIASLIYVFCLVFMVYSCCCSSDNEVKEIDLPKPTNYIKNPVIEVEQN